MNTEELKEAVEYFKWGVEGCLDKDCDTCKHTRVMIKLAESVIKASESLPKRIDSLEYIKCSTHNKIIEDCTLIIARDYVKKSSLPSYQQIKEVSAQGYCTKRNENKELDGDLLEDVSYGIYKLITGE